MKNKLQQLRTAKHWSQADIAIYLGVSRQTVNAIETGRYDPSLPLAFRLARLFNTTIEEVFTPNESLTNKVPLMNKVYAFHQPKALKHAFVITQDNAEIGSLTYDNASHSRAHAVLDNLQWQLVQKGIINTEVTVFSAGSPQPIVTYRKPALKSKGSLLVDGVEYTFAKKGFGLKSRYTWSTPQMPHVIIFAQGGFMKTAGEITADDNLLSTDTGKLLVALGLFLGLNNDEDEASAAAA